jgi:hypothetical protein
LVICEAERAAWSRILFELALEQDQIAANSRVVMDLQAESGSVELFELLFRNASARCVCAEPTP